MNDFQSCSRFGLMDHHYSMSVRIQLELETVDVTWKTMMSLVTLMVAIVVPMQQELEMVCVMKKTKMKSVNMMGWIAAKIGHQ